MRGRARTVRRAHRATGPAALGPDLAQRLSSRLRPRSGSPFVPSSSPRPSRSRLLGLVLLLTSLGALAAPRDSVAPDPAAHLPAAGREAIRRGLEAVDCAVRAGEPAARRLAVIDYRLPSTRPRLWVLDLETGEVLFEEWVAHGRGSGEVRAVRFSNVENSHHSSLGLYRTLESYEGDNGYSLRLDGLEPGINDRAWSRAIVMHGADYVSRSFIRSAGRLGRSHGCPAVRREVAVPLIDAIKDGQYLFVYYPDAAWLAGSAYLGCTAPGAVKAGTRAAADAEPAVATLRGVAD